MSAAPKKVKIFSTTAKLILASGSPRRREFLEELGLEFLVRAADVPEELSAGESPEEFVRRLSLEKAKAVSVSHPDCWVLGADTVVVSEGEILGKPSGPEQAWTMLKGLNGRWHEVWTGFSLHHGKLSVSVQEAVVTKVRFARMADEVLQLYAFSGEPLDKAGAYGIQGRGGMLVEQIAGSYSNVVGLPLVEVINALLVNKVIEPLLVGRNYRG